MVGFLLIVNLQTDVHISTSVIISLRNFAVCFNINSLYLDPQYGGQGIDRQFGEQLVRLIVFLLRQLFY